MILFECIVEGPPVSYQARNRSRLQAWGNTVRAAAQRVWPVWQAPFTGPLLMVVVYYHDGPTVRLDNDNMIKPVQDALNGLVYVDDSQITDTQTRKSDLNGRFKTRGMSAVLAEGFSRGSEFLYIKIEQAPDHTELL